MDMMNNYEFNEGIEFEGLIPEVMEADGISTIGASDFNAMVFKNGQLGSGSLEVIDFQAVMGGGVNPEPEPVYDTEIHATFNPPRGFDNDNQLYATFYGTKLPEDDKYDICYIWSDVDDIMDIVQDFYTREKIRSGVEFQFACESSDSGTRPLYLYFFNGDELVWKCKIIIDNE